MPFDYYLVLGGYLDPYQALMKAIELIRRQFNIQAVSKFYVGPSEDPNINHDFMNVALHILDDRLFDNVKQVLMELEQLQLSHDVKVVDIDLLIQKDVSEVVYVSPKVSFCHSLITLKDVCPNLLIDEHLLLDQYHAKQNKGVFSVIQTL